jgi:hypothetical protein
MFHSSFNIGLKSKLQIPFTSEKPLNVKQNIKICGKADFRDRMISKYKKKKKKKKKKKLKFQQNRDFHKVQRMTTQPKHSA